MTMVWREGVESVSRLPCLGRRRLRPSEERLGREGKGREGKGRLLVYYCYCMAGGTTNGND